MSFVYQYDKVCKQDINRGQRHAEDGHKDEKTL